MRIIEAESIFGVYLTLMYLTKCHKPHTVKNISDVLGGSLSNPTIAKELDELEKFGAIVAPKGLPKGSRKGHTFSFTLNYSKFPQSVLTAISSKSTIRRNKIRAAEAGIASYVDGKCFFDAEGFLNQCGEEILDEFTKMARQLDPQARIDRAWFRKHVHGREIEFSDQPMWSYATMVHRFICSKTRN